MGVRRKRRAAYMLAVGARPRPAAEFKYFRDAARAVVATSENTVGRAAGGYAAEYTCSERQTLIRCDEHTDAKLRVRYALGSTLECRSPARQPAGVAAAVREDAVVGRLPP